MRKGKTGRVERLLRGVAEIRITGAAPGKLINACCRERITVEGVGPDDPTSPMRVLVELDIINAYERVRAYYLNIAETLAGGKR